MKCLHRTRKCPQGSWFQFPFWFCWACFPQRKEPTLSASLCAPWCIYSVGDRHKILVCFLLLCWKSAVKWGMSLDQCCAGVAQGVHSTPALHIVPLTPQLMSNCPPVWQVNSSIGSWTLKKLTKSITLWAWPKRKHLKDWREFLFAPASSCAWCYRLSQSWGAGSTPASSICLRAGKPAMISLWIFSLVHKKRKQFTFHACFFVVWRNSCFLILKGLMA